MEIDDEKAAEYMEQLKRIPMVEPFPARDGWNVHETTRLALRSYLASEKSAEFRQLSSLAVQCFPGDQPHEKIERLYHLFVAVSPEAESYLSTLSEEWDDREELLALGPMLLELSSDSLLSKLSKKTAACFPPTSPGSPNSANSCATENPPITPHKPSKTLRKPLENPPKTPRFSSHLIPRISRSQPAQLFYLPSFQSLNRYFSKTPLASK